MPTTMGILRAWLITASLGLFSSMPAHLSVQELGEQVEQAAPCEIAQGEEGKQQDEAEQKQAEKKQAEKKQAEKKQAEKKQAAKKTKLFVIVNKANPIDSLTIGQVKTLFLRKDLTWERVLAKAKKKGSGFSKSEKVRPIEFTRKTENELFLKHVLEKDKDSLERHWIKLQYQSAIRRPKRVGTPERVLKYTSALKGCVGFINADALTKAHKKHVKVVLTLEY